jgi:diaminohydroxyphosphoribosylaminopyrimidine deaminase/5-amino-6-(5-phosphoribosylamino)uracil reductase
VTTAQAPTDADLTAMRRACALAARGAGSALPNPVVGCVLLAPDGTVVGEGFHERAGGPHAEVVALRAAGERAAGATAVVSLEPCNHTGRTGPCSEALLAAGVARVGVAVRDPWVPAAGGIERLRAAGVPVVDLSQWAGVAVTGDPASAPAAVPAAAVADLSPVTGDPGPTSTAVTGGPATADARVRAVVAAAEDVNRVWLTAARRQRPFVTVKTAMSLDGRIAAEDGTSQWISSPSSRAEVHELRRRVDSIAVGVGTVLADDPQLTARDADGTVTGRQPLRVVVDSRGRTPAAARVLDDAAPSLLATVEEIGAGPDGRVDLAALLARLYRDGRRHLLVEGGPRLAAAFLDAHLADEVLIYLAPLLLGAGRSALEGGAVTTLADAHRAELRELRRLGPDVVLRYRMMS